jgi:hypothetical protein
MTSHTPIGVKTLSRIFGIGRINVSNSKILDLPDDLLSEIVRIIEFDIIYKKDLHYKELLKLIYRHFENFEILIPYLQRLDKYPIGIPEPVESGIKKTDDCVRASIFTFGTYIMLKRYGGIFSQLVQFLYFYVQYLKVNGIRLESEHPITEEVHKYLLQYHPIETNYTDNELHTSYKRFLLRNYWDVDTLISHINEDDTRRPSFFISSFQKKDIVSETTPPHFKFISYVNRTHRIVDKINDELTNYNNNITHPNEPISFLGYPVLIYIKKNKKAFTKGDMTDYVFPPYIPLSHISSIRTPSINQLTYSSKEDGEKLDYDTIYGEMYNKYVEEHKHLFPQTGGKKLKKKEILGTEKCIYKKQGDRKEYIRHKGKLITVKEYRKIKANK